MIKIVKYGCEFNIPKKCVVKLDATYDGIIVTLSDNTDIRFSFAVSPQIKAILPIVKSTPADIVTLNLDYAINGQYDKVLTLASKQQMVVENNTVKTQPKKTGGRPKGSKTKKTTNK